MNWIKDNYGKVLIAAAIAFGIWIMVTPAKADGLTEPVCVTVEAQKYEISEIIKAQEVRTGKKIPYTVAVYEGVVGDNYLANVLKLAGYDEASITTAVESVSSVVLFHSDMIPNDLLVPFDNNGCKLGQLSLPPQVREQVEREATIS